ncbi:MAG: hypothetical protein IK045_04145 [Bacteroidales bacterium]|nr:hypothetical protein [Bacteroidales bacterium]
MDIDARINWTPGMELSAQTFRELDRNLDYRQQVAVRAALGGMRFGLLPGAEFNVAGVFVKNTYEIENFKCLAVLPSGRLLGADESVVVPIPMLFGEEYYLTVAISDEEKVFEKENVPYVRYQKVFAIHTLEELGKDDLFPVSRFKVADGVFSIDADYIPPCLLLDTDPRIAGFGAAYIERLQAISSHANLEEGEGKRAILRYLFLLKGYQWDGGVREFVQLTQEIAQAIDYYIVSPHTDKPVEVPVPSFYDIRKWLQWFSDYLAGAVSILDTVVLEDNSIDYEALLAQAKAELYEKLNPELRADLLLQIKDELRFELTEHLSASLMNFINEKLKPGLHDSLSSELSPALHDKLYEELYEQLYNALYVPSQEEEDYCPLI